jgi:hypothetical protein
MMTVKAISLWQPWATLVAIGAKRFETRSWATPYRGPLVIHAAKRALTHDDKMMLNERAFSYHLHRAGFNASSLPFGKALCVVDVVNIHRTERVRDFISADERAFGDYSTGRYAWELSNLRPFADSVDLRGMQGLFDFHCPLCDDDGLVIVGWDALAYENVEGECPICSLWRDHYLKVAFA